MTITRLLLASTLALASLIGIINLGLRWEARATPVFFTTVKLHSHPTPVVGGLRHNWSGDMQIVDAAGNVLAQFTAEDVAMMSVRKQNQLGAPWRVIVALIVAPVAALTAWLLMMQSRESRRRGATEARAQAGKAGG